MLEDRDYMRSPEFGTSPGWRYSLTTILLAVNAAVFIVQAIAEESLRGNQFVRDYLALSLHGLGKGYLWQPLTFQFLHSSIFHLLCNLVLIYFFGREIEQTLGRARSGGLYLASGVFGGLLQILGSWAWPSHFSAAWVVGASAGAFGLVATYATMFPERVITFLAFFVIPINLKAKYLLWGGAGLALLGILAPKVGGNIAHLAHLGGMLVGLGYVLWTTRVVQPSPPRRHLFMRRKEYAPLPTAKTTWRGSKTDEPIEAPSAEFISKEVDPILDKISAQGMQSLTPRERRILEAASAKIERR